MARLPEIQELVKMNHSNMWQLLFHKIPYSWDIVESNRVYRHTNRAYIFGTFSLVYLSAKHPYYNLPAAQTEIYGYPIECIGIVWERIYFPWHLMSPESIQELCNSMTTHEFQEIFDPDIKHAATQSAFFPKHWLKISYTNLIDPAKPETTIVKLPRSYREKDLDLVMAQLDQVYMSTSPTMKRSDPIPIPMSPDQSRAKEIGKPDAPKRGRAIPRIK